MIWLVFLLVGCVGKGKYAAALDDQEDLYARIDGMTAAMNGMSAELVAAKESAAASQREVDAAKAAISSSGGQVLDLSERLAQLAAVDAVETLRKLEVERRAAVHASIAAELEKLVAARVVQVAIRDGDTTIELPVSLILDGSSLNDAGRKALSAVAAPLLKLTDPVVVLVALDGEDAWKHSALAAADVAQALVATGVAATRVTAAGVGNTRPVPEGSFAGARRVELRIAPTSVPQAQ